MQNPRLRALGLTALMVSIPGLALAQPHAQEEPAEAHQSTEPPSHDSPESREKDDTNTFVPSPERTDAQPNAAEAEPAQVVLPAEVSEPYESLGPALPEGMTLDQVLALAARPPPEHFPNVIHDDSILAFFLADQFEYRADGKSKPDVLGWEANGWIGGDYNRLLLKPEGAATFHSPGSLESETDLLYSRLIRPFWSAQLGVQYANAWQSGGDYGDRWSGVMAIQGLAPGKFELDASAYVSEDADFSAVLEIEYDWRITQRLVAQPRTELAFAFQDIPGRNIGAGLTDVVAGLRLRYELKRELAPYLGFRYEGRAFESAERTRDAGETVWRVFGVAGVRFALL